MSTYPSTVRQVSDGNPVNAAYTNQAAQDLASRTEWLKDQLATAVAGTATQLTGQAVDSTLPAGTPVYWDFATLKYKAAQAGVNPATFATASSNAFVEGIITATGGGLANITTFGSIVLSTVTWAAVFDTGTFAAGPIYLSTTAGKISASAGTLGIYIGTLRSDGRLIFRPANTGPFLNHIHMQETLLGKPAGTVTDPAFGAVHSVTAPNITQQGWLPATDVYFPGYVVGVQIPTNAKFGYNLQHASETSLRSVFPVVPSTNAQFSQNGVILDTTLIVVNDFGIWWIDDAYGRAPWSVDYNAYGNADSITLWTSRLVADVSLSDTVESQVIANLINGGLASIGVTSVKSGDAGVTVTGTSGDNSVGFKGELTITNTGANSVVASAGVSATGTAGTTAGWRGAITLRSTATRNFQFLYNSNTVNPVAPVTTNGVITGVNMGLYAHRLGSNPADFIDFVLHTGSTEFNLGETVQFISNVMLFVDDPAGTSVQQTYTIQMYKLLTGSPASSASLIETYTASGTRGLPGQVQTSVIGNSSNRVIGNGVSWIFRIMNGTGVGAIPTGKLSIVGIASNLVGL